MSEAAGIRAGRAFVEIVGNDSKLAKTLKLAEGRMRAFGQELAKIGTIQMAALSTAVSAPFVAGVKTFAGFEDALAGLRAAANPTAAQFEAVKKAVLDLSRTTGMTPTALVAGFTELLKAGLSVEQVLSGAAEATIKFARVGGLEVGAAATMMADALNVFAKEGLSAANVVDILSRAADGSSISLEQISMAFSQASAAFGMTNQKLNDLAIAIGLLGNAGVKGSDAGTSLRTMMLRLAGGTDESRAIIERLGIALRDAGGQMRPLRDVIGELQAKLGGLGQQARDETLIKLFGADAVRAGTILLTQGVAGWDAFAGKLGGALTVAQKFDQMSSTLLGSLRELWAAVQRVGIAVGEALAGPIRFFVDALKAGTSAIAAITEKFPKLSAALISVGAAATIGTGSLMGLGLAMKGLSVVSNLNLLSTGLSAISSGFSAVTTAATTSITSLGSVAKTMGQVLSLNPSLTTMVSSMGKFQAALAMAAPVLAVAGAVAGLAYALAQATKYTAELSDEMEKVRAKGDELRTADLDQMQRLQDLAKKQRLNKQEMAEAQRIAGNLESRYGALGVTIDSSTGQIHGAANAFKILTQNMRELTAVQLDKEINEIKGNINSLTKEIQNQAERARFTWSALGDSINPWGKSNDTADKARIEEIIASEAKRNEQFKKLDELTKRRKRMMGGDTNALTGASPTAGSASVPGVAPTPEADEQAAQKAEDWARRVHQLRLEMIRDEHQRELALLDEKYDHELAEAEKAGADRKTLQDIEASRALERSNLQRRYAEQQMQDELRMRQELDQLRINGIQDQHEREVAAIKSKYGFEIAQAQRVNDLRKAALLHEMRAVELQAAQANEAVRLKEKALGIARADADRQEDVEELKLRATLRGYELERALLQLQRRRALAAAVESGEDASLINKQFDLKERLAAMDQKRSAPETSISGSFFTQALSGLAGGAPLDAIKKATQETAAYVRKIANMPSPRSSP